MKTIKTSLIVLLSALSLILCALHAHAAVDGTISGHVTDSITGVPLQIRVYLYCSTVEGQPDYVTTTGADGYYLFDVPRFKWKQVNCLTRAKTWLTYAVYIAVPGSDPYASEELQFSPEVYNITHDVALEPTPYGTISGHVHDSVTGEPLRGVTLTTH